MFGLKKAEKQFTYIPLKDILPAPYQPRRLFEAARLDELSRSIKKYGVLQPIIVRRMGKRYEVIAGERRIRAASIAGLIKIPAIITNMSDSEAASCALLENIQRENLTFLDESDGYFKLASDGGLNIFSLACALCRDDNSVEEKLRFKRLAPTVKKAIAYHRISEAHARLILRISNDETRLKVINKITENNYDVTQTQELVEKLLIGEMPVVHSNQKYCSGDIRLFTNTLKQTVDIMKRSGVKAYASEHDCDECYEYTIRIAK
ncbi:MAG: ParB/RepB/Spo0J family partition protein [Bacillota bacterium]|nr:ParB/RepB/Spo0J family partition protein [Bacillota bacterium]